MKGAVIFDLDGTLLDTLPDIAKNVNTALSHFNFPTLTKEVIKGYIGDGAKELIYRSLPQSKKDMVEEVLKYYLEVCKISEHSLTKPFSEIYETLSELKKRGYIIALLTNKNQTTLDRVYDLYLKDYGFIKAVGVSSVTPPKPNPLGVITLLKELDVNKENAYFVGDGEADVLTSINAKIKGVSALWGYRDKEALKKVGATLFAPTPTSLLDIIL